MRVALVLGLVLAGGLALAEGEIRLDVELGKTVERNVGYVQGWMCDDPSLVEAGIVTRNDTNIWIVKGIKLGQTLCRVGTNPYATHYVFDVHVVKKK